MKAEILNNCWMASCYRDARKFVRDANRLQAAQERLLLRTIRRNRNCWFGLEHGFRDMHSVADFRKRVPVAEYVDFRNEIDRICAGEQGVLTSEPVLLLEPTSGTSAQEKLIPFTASLRREFQRAVRPWIYDLFEHIPAARKGRAYWSISPLAQSSRVTKGGIPIGFADDTAYLGGWERGIVRRTLAVPPQVALVADVKMSRYVTLFFLLQAEDLSLISVWSPTFLIELLREMREEFQPLCDSIERGRLDVDGFSENVLAHRCFTPNRRRAEFLRSVIRSVSNEDELMGLIWPKLALISGWADGGSATYAAFLKEMISGINFQPKGLLSTEAFVSLPLVQHGSAALSYQSHFFEFVLVDESDSTVSDTLLAHELEEDCQYEVIVTTGGGLYRYRLFDQVEVVGRFHQVPLLNFVGRGNATSDLVGEKLTEAQAVAAIHSSFSELDVRPSFVSLVPIAGPPARYCLEISTSQFDFDSAKLQRLACRLDTRLRQHASYAYARELGQLAEIDVRVAASSQTNGWADYEATCLTNGQRLGDVKPGVFGNESSVRSQTP